MAYRDEVLADNPVAYWRLGEAAGVGTAADEVGALPGTYTGTLTLETAGALSGDADTAVDFLGTGYVTWGTAGWRSVLSGASAVTLELWFKRSGNPAQREWILGETIRDTYYGGTALYLETDGTLRLTGRSTHTESGEALPGVGVVTDDSWHHIVGVLDFANDQMLLYIDGQLDASAAVTFDSSTRVYGTASTDATTMAYGPTEGYLAYSADEFALYGSVLSADRIWQHYVAGAYTGYAHEVMALSPVAYWRLDEAVGASTAVDETGNHDGTYSGPTLEQTSLLAGGSGFSVNFDGTDEITLPNLGFSGSSAFTFAAWVDLSGVYTGNEQLHFFNWGSAATGQASSLRTRDDGTEGLRHAFYGTPGQFAATLSDGPHHIAMTYDGTNREFFVDGVSIGSDAPGAQSMADTGYTLGSITSLGFSTGKLQGLMDDPAFFDTALTAAQIQALYNAGAGVEETITLSDTVAGTTVLSLAGSIPIAESGAGADSFSASVAALVSDTLFGVDAPYVQNILTMSDSATAADGFAAPAALSLEDAGATLDYLARNIAFSLTEAVASIESLKAFVTLALGDSGTGVAVLTDPSTQQALVEAAVSTDTYVVQADIPVFELGSGLESPTASVLLFPVETATGLDTVSYLLRAAQRAVSDAGSAASTVLISVRLGPQDAGVGFEALSAQVALAQVDSGQGLDTVYAYSILQEEAPAVLRIASYAIDITMD